MAVFGLLVVALTLLLTLVFGSFLRQHSLQRSASELESVAGNAAALLAEGLLERSREVEVLAGSEILWREGLDSRTVTELLARSQAIHPHSLWIGVAGTGGLVRAATGNLLVGQSVQDRPWFVHGGQGLYVGDVHPAKLLESKLPRRPQGEPLRFLDFSAPVRVAGRTIGVLGIHASWDWARQVVEGLLPAHAAMHGLQIFVFDRAGAPIYAPGGQAETLRLADQTSPLAPAHGDTTGRQAEPRIVRWFDGKDYLTAAVGMTPRNAASDLGWQIVAREPEHVALAAMRAALPAALGVGVAAALLACLVAWLAARRLSQDLHRVAHAAEQVEQRQAGAAIPVLGSNHEVLKLSGSLHSMTQRLLTANEDMERQVRQRTSELEVANRALDQLVRRDPLTGVLNRRGFQSQSAPALALAQRGTRPVSLLMLDADHFKRVNDQHGHAVGDEVLRSLARTMAERLRASDVVARLGGEEFAALLPDTDLASARIVAEALREDIAARPHAKAGQVTVSIGLAPWRSPDEDLESLLQRADSALYDAKRQGRDRVAVADASSAA